MVPVTVTNAPNPLLNHPSDFNHAFPPRYSAPGSINGFCLPNGAPVQLNGHPIHNGANLYRPSAPSGPNGVNWSPMPSTGRYISRTGWTSTNKTSGGVRKPKRIRTAFTSQQMMELEQEYGRTRYLDRTRRIELADILHLNERTIKIWFQNRRMKEKKDKAESLEEEAASSTTDSSIELGNGMPVVLHEQMPENNFFQRGVYIEPYPMTSVPCSMPPTSLPSNMPPAQNQIHAYPTYVPEGYEPQCRQVHLQLQHYPPAYNGELQEIVEESPPQLESPAVVPNNNSNNIIDQSWDLSWIRSIHISDDC